MNPNSMATASRGPAKDYRYRHSTGLTYTHVTYVPSEAHSISDTSYSHTTYAPTAQAFTPSYTHAIHSVSHTSLNHIQTTVQFSHMHITHHSHAS